MNKLLALDQSSHITGYAIFDNGQLIKYGKFSCDIPELDARLVQIKQKVKELIDEYQIDYVVLEDIQQQSNVANNVQTFKILAEVLGVLVEFLEEQQICHSCVLASTWKAQLGIKGRTRAEQKRNAQAYILDTYNIKATQDESDAICIGRYMTQKSPNDWTN